MKKKKIIILNKYDLADNAKTEKWIEYFNKKERKVVLADSLTGKGVNETTRQIQKIMEDEMQKMADKGRIGRKIRVMIVGIPNVGKSSFINRIAKKTSAEVGNKPGVTKQKQWIRINEKIEFLFQNNIVKIIGNEKVEKVEQIKTKLVQKEDENRLSPVNIEGSNYIINADYIIMALGSNPDKIVNTLGLELDKWNNIKINENYQTSKENIYAAGDLAGVRGTVAWAAFSGREAAKSIIKALNKKKLNI